MLSTTPSLGVEFNVTVPDGTMSCYVVGKFNNWSPQAAVRMKLITKNHFYINLPTVSEDSKKEGYKYISGRDWIYVETKSDGTDISNRTVHENMDEVVKWRSKGSHPNVKYDTITCTPIAGIQSRILEILLPHDYENNQTKHYPVMYVHNIKQFYYNGGRDGDAKDNFYSSKSWDVARTVDSLQVQGIETGIIVNIYANINDLSPWNNDEYMGSGSGNDYMDLFLNQIIPYIENNYRVSNEVHKTSIAGADMGGLFALYVALKNQHKFGRVGLFSPSLWFNKENLTEYINLWQKTNDDFKCYFHVGDREGADFQETIYDIYKSLEGKGFFQGDIVYSLKSKAIHRDSSWKNEFEKVYKYLLDYNLNEEKHYQFMSHAGGNDVVCTGDEPLKKSFYYPDGTEDNVIEVMSYIKEVPADIKITYYYNINKGTDCTGENLLYTNKAIGFNDVRTSVCWIRALVDNDESYQSVHASKDYFRVCTKDNFEGILMQQTKKDGTEGEDDSYTVSAELSFDKNKKFIIHFGGVNNGYKQAVLTDSISVDATCTKAQIIYNYATNKVTVKVLETDLGSPYDINKSEINDYDDNSADESKGQKQTITHTLSSPSITSFQATPAICRANTVVTVSASVENMDDYEFLFRFTDNNGSTVNHDYIINENNECTFTFKAIEGFYKISFMALKTGSPSLIQTIWVKVNENKDDYETTGLIANPYSEVDWSTTKQYKGNFHTHTDQSFDSSVLPNIVVDRYHQNNYQLLALTDHDMNTYPWSMFKSLNYNAENVDSDEMDMLSFPSIELSKDNRNTGDEISGGSFNHHNDFFTGRKGQEFATLQESFAYTQKLGGMQIINHPGRYWSISKQYDNDNFEKNSPAWHARNFRTYESLIGLEVYNQGNRFPNDRILWDQILELTMPERPVFGYSNDDAHTFDHYFKNYQFMLMEDLSITALKNTMRTGSSYFSYERGGSGEAKAPRIHEIVINEDNKTIYIDSDNGDVYWISGTHFLDGDISTRRSSIVGYGKTFYYEGFKGNYVRAFMQNQYGETCSQPFGFGEKLAMSQDLIVDSFQSQVNIYPNPTKSLLHITSKSEISTIRIYNVNGQIIFSEFNILDNQVEYNLARLSQGMYIVEVITSEYTDKKLLKIIE
ncbi:MAG: alpha/beta hydrolase-fold protein [Paludibacter sp.]|jgi:predicted alpha/beta superfamily hydrolase